jgi:hypothetical protein
MTRFAGLMCCLFAALSFVLGAQCACGTGGLSITQPAIKAPTSPVMEAQSHTYDDYVRSAPKGVSSPKPGSHLKLVSDLEGLADSRVSQPEAGAS